MTGYQEIMTDPSYLNQVIVFTTPYIGNVGCNSLDIESKITVKGIIVREKPTDSSNWRAEKKIEDWCNINNVFCLYGIDTRTLVKKIRNKQAGTGIIGYAENLDKILKINQKDFDTECMDLASLACHKEIFKIENNGKKIAVIDFGIKNNILNCLSLQGFDLTIYPCTKVKENIDLINKADGLVLSNGPGDPRATLKNIPKISVLIDNFIKNDKAILGICLGHQILCLVAGVRVEKMSQGHRGGNQPVLNTITNKVEITAQNHGFSAIKSDLEDKGLYEKYISLFDGIVEGAQFKKGRVISVQYHPESSPGPRDSRYIFEDFKRMFE
jgi:carbamoyl-phosphate synthase small subunit